MSDKEHLLYSNAMTLAKSVAQTFHDMAGTDYQICEDSLKKVEYRFPAMMHAIIRFYGIVQGEYILSLKEETAANLAEVCEEGLPTDECMEYREEYEGFVSEVVNAAAGRAIQELEKKFGELTAHPGKIVYGEMVYPDIPSICVDLKGDAGPVSCCFVLNLMNLKIGQKLQDAWDEIQFKEREIEQVRKNMKQIMATLPDLNKTVDKLFIIQNLIRQNPGIQSLKDGSGLGKYFEQLAGVSSKLRRILMLLWSVPLQQTFEKAGEMAEQLSKRLGKSLHVSISGGKTEIDRQADDTISEVLAHVIQNAIDHGIESSGERRMLGKPEKGTLRLSSGMQGGHVIIEIEDDGRGLNRKRLIERSEKLGIIEPDKALAEHEIDQLIFHDQLIFRGDSRPMSGLHEVKTVLKRIKGSIEVRSFPGKGCVFTIRIPVAISTTEGMIVNIDSQFYIIPILNIREALRLKREDCFTVKGKGEMIRIRGKLLSLIRLDELFGTKQTRKNPWEAMVIVVENKGELRCILADEIMGKQEVVIQNIGESGWIRSKCIVGGSIMADGHVSLVLDIRSIFRLHHGSEE